MNFGVSRSLWRKLDDWEPLPPHFSDEEDSEPPSDSESDEAKGNDVFEVEVPEKITLSIDRVLNVRWRVSIHKNAEGERWLKSINVECIGPNGKIGSASSYYIDPGAMRFNFQGEMDEISQELSNLAGAVFDGVGHFQERLMDKGNEAWSGEDLDFGPLLVIETLEINNRAMRRHGLGKALCKLLISAATKISKLEEAWSPIHAIITPGVLTHDHEEESRGKGPAEKNRMYYQSLQLAVRFWRSVGFRRIGDTSFFAYSTDRDHPSRSIGKTQDFDPPASSQR